MVNRTALGRQMEAVSQDRLGALLQGININRVSAIICAVGCALAAVAGCLMGAYQGLSATMGDTMNLRILMLVMLAGAGSMNGIMITGIVMGFLDSLFPVLIQGNAASAAAIAIVVVLLLAKPKGFFGHEM
jgi:branched-chain amino acid transport system permease protein